MKERYQNFIIAVFISVSASAYVQSKEVNKALDKTNLDCSDFLGTGDETRIACTKEVCNEVLAKNIGIWDGAFQLQDDEGKSQQLERRVLFSKHACFFVPDRREHLIVGRELHVYPKTEKQSSRSEKGLVVKSISEKGDQGITWWRPGTGVLRFKLTSEKAESSLWETEFKAYESCVKKSYIWRESLARAGARDKELRIIERCERADKVMQEKPLFVGTYKSLLTGDVSHFAGRAWVFGRKGNLLAKRDSILERIYDPAEGEIIQRETLETPENGKSTETQFTILDEQLGRVEMSSRSEAKDKLSKIDKMDYLAGSGDIITEERLLDRNGHLTKILLRSSTKVSRSEFDERMKKSQQNSSKLDLR